MMKLLRNSHPKRKKLLRNSLSVQVPTEVEAETGRSAEIEVQEEIVIKVLFG